MNDKFFEKKLLKLAVTERGYLDKILEHRISANHFIDNEESRQSKILSKIFTMAVDYHLNSSGSLLTDEVFTAKINDSKIKEDLKSDVISEWMDIHSQIVSIDDFHQLAEQIKQSYATKLLNNTLANLQTNLTTEGLKNAVSKMQSELDLVSDQFFNFDADRKTFDITENSSAFAAEYMRRYLDRDKFTGITCGLPEIDNKTFGWFPGQVVVILAPTAGGKSVQMLNWALHANCVCKKRVLYFSFEMDGWLCELRHLSNIFDIPYWKIKSQNLGEMERDALFSSYRQLQGQPYFEYDVNIEDPTPEYVDSRIRQLISTKGKPEFIIVDYIGNMTTRNAGRDKKVWERQGDALEKLFIIAKRYQIPILTAQQINRESIRENRKNRNDGKGAAYYQDAASGDQRLMHLSTYVIGIEPDKENNIAVFHPVKMRDAYFEPFVAMWDAQYNKVMPLTEHDQEQWKILKGLSRNPEKENSGGKILNQPKKYSQPMDEEEDDDKIIPWA